MLNDLITSLEQEKRMAEKEREELIKLKAEAKKRLTLIKDKRDEYIGKVEEKCNNRLLELELEIENIKKEVAKKERTSIAKSKKQLYSLRERFGGETVKKQEAINIGDYVMVKTLGSKGRIVDIDRAGDTYEVIVGNARMKLKRFFLEKTATEKESNGAARDHIDVEKIDEPELNVMGMRVEEALNTLDRFLDRAVVEGVPRVKILHGIGTGKLMQAIREHLTDARYIKALQRDERNSGITIVEFA
jgi:DNA mismatch repair protein MutS2